MAQPTLSAVEMIGRPRGERWDFLEVYSGCGNFAPGVFALGMVVCPAVDMVYKAGGLRLDCLLENSQALLQAVLAEARPSLITCSPPLHVLALHWQVGCSCHGRAVGHLCGRKQGLIGALHCAC